MDTTSAADLARELGTSVPRVTRAVRRLGLDARQPNGRFAFTPGQADCIRRALGVVPPAEGMSRTELRTLAALRSAPFGLASARAVARRSGLSPTASAGALRSLHLKGLVERSRETIAAGRAREVNIWRANFLDRRWPSIDPILKRVEQPATPARRKDAPGRVPRRLRHLFWNTAESQLDVNRAGPYIARRVLRTMDLQGLAWGAQALGADDWTQAARARGLDPKVKRLAFNLAVFPTKHQSATPSIDQLTEPTVVAGLSVAGLQDLMAMKIKVMAERGEMRDYFDVKAIDELSAVSVEEGIELYMRRYGVAPNSDALPHLYRTMGDLSDVEVDEALPVDLEDLQRWWGARQIEVLRNSDRFG